ncbi:protein of membrane protein,Tapt1/CMV receptor family [Pseudohyphozyma bogoriensis]|nr:protein of membrane protein,Tapt1/CMV receptor family [Pseudohyphozyma bogoriensis]
MEIDFNAPPSPPLAGAALQSRSLPDLTLLTSEPPEPPSEGDDTPPNDDRDDRDKWSPGSRSPSPWDEDDYRRSPSIDSLEGRGGSSREQTETPPPLPPDLAEILRTPTGAGNGLRRRISRSDSRSRSESPDEYRITPTRRREDDDDDDSFALHHPERGQSSYSIHSAPAEFDSPEMDRGREGSYALDDVGSPGSPEVEDGRRSFASGGKGFRLPFSLYEYLQEEILAVEMDGEEGLKGERVTNFLTVPGEVEKIILFGFIICLDSFLYTFTILPLRVFNALYHFVLNNYNNFFTRGRRRHLRLSHKCDIAKGFIIIGTLLILHRMTDASKMYHTVRGQDTIKLYVIFNVLEIADRLCCSFGQDLQDSLFSKQAFGRRTDGSHPALRPVALITLNMAYVVAHTLVLFYQLVTLNVTINSYSNALLTLLMSNQFVEIKGSVFKKFEKENLFQLTCADIVERFQLGLMLFIIALRNLIELSSTSSSASLSSILPSSFSVTFALPSYALLQSVISPGVVVLASECFVDWLKHAFITKFNHIRPAVYGRFIDVLCKDLVVGAGRRQDQPFVDQSPLVSRRLGFAAIPLGCLVVRVLWQAFEMLADDSHVDECAPSPGGFFLESQRNEFGRPNDLAGKIAGWVVIVLVCCIGWACLVVLKLLIGINLRAFASARWARMEEREHEDNLNGRSRAPIGRTAKEEVHERETKRLFTEDLDAAGKTRQASLTTLGRYDMVKSRVW